ncbi:hypothetical protein [Saccharothrix sp. Mg75]|uniref:hypothetical protein n=1 Tax=Saccharothrix sp. Mg75 TaxID=3445357 RepID=UPI003EEFB8E3
MSHRLLPRSGRGCFSAVVLLPLAAAGGLAALLLAVDRPAPPPGAVGSVWVSGRQAPASARAGVPAPQVATTGTTASTGRREVQRGGLEPTSARRGPGVPVRTDVPRPGRPPDRSGPWTVVLPPFPPFPSSPDPVTGTTTAPVPPRTPTSEPGLSPDHPTSAPATTAPPATTPPATTPPATTPPATTPPATTPPATAPPGTSAPGTGSPTPEPGPADPGTTDPAVPPGAGRRVG